MPNVKVTLKFFFIFRQYLKNVVEPRFQDVPYYKVLSPMYKIIYIEYIENRFTDSIEILHVCVTSPR